MTEPDVQALRREAVAALRIDVPVMTCRLVGDRIELTTRDGRHVYVRRLAVPAWDGLRDDLRLVLERAGMTPEQVRGLDDAALLALDGIGPAKLKALRAWLGAA